MITRNLKHLYAAAFLAAFVGSQSAMAQDLKTTINSKIASGSWLSGLITAGLAMLAIVQVVQRWQAIFEGSDVFKHVTVIGSLIGLTVWWSSIVGYILSVTA